MNIEREKTDVISDVVEIDRLKTQLAVYQEDMRKDAEEIKRLELLVQYRDRKLQEQQDKIADLKIVVLNAKNAHLSEIVSLQKTMLEQSELIKKCQAELNKPNDVKSRVELYFASIEGALQSATGLENRKILKTLRNNLYFVLHGEELK
jgi:chromosome segregation ATPase